MNSIVIKRKNVLYNINFLLEITKTYSSISEKQQHNRTISAELQNVKLKSFDDIPGPKTYPLVGSLISLRREGLNYNQYEEFCAKLNAKYGDIVKLKLPDFNQVIVFDPEYVKKLYQADGDTPIRPEAKPWKEYFRLRGIPGTLVNSQDEQWRKLRTASNPILARPKNVYFFLSKQNKIGNEFVNLIEEKLDTNKTIVLNEFQENLKLLALEMVSVVAFDQALNCIDERKRTPNITKVINAVDDFFTYSGQLVFNDLLWRIYPTKNWKKFEAAADIVYNTVRKYVKEAHDDMMNKSEEFKQDMTSKTILQQYILNMEKYKLSFEDIIALTSDFLVAGIDTTSTVLHCILYELGKQPDIQKVLYEEIRANCKDNDDLSEDKLEKMQFLKAVVKETLRLHPVAPGSARTLREDIVLKDYLVPKGVTVVSAARWITTSDNYFKNAKEFNPKRWLKNDKFYENINPYSSLPFGFGARMCIGRRIAEQEIYLIITKIINRYHVDYLGEKIGHKVRLIAAPDTPLHIKFTKRNTH